MGESIDTQAPGIEITWPANNQYVPKKFTLKGNATENKEISDIEVQYTYQTIDPITSEKVKLNKTKHTNTSNKRTGPWTCDLEFEFDQDVSIVVYIKDGMGNSSVDSSDSILVIVDSDPPSNDDILITRNNGFTTRTAKITKFTDSDGYEANKNESANKDRFQNEWVVLSAQIEENYEVSESYLNLYEITNYVSEGNYKKTLIKADIKTKEGSTNKFYPEFTVSQEDLPDTFETGVHYVMPEIIVVDVAGNKSSPLNPEIPLVFAWEKAYDEPKVSYPLYYDDVRNKLKFPQGTSVPIVIFDDDGIKEYKWTLTNTKDSTITRTGTGNVAEANLRDHNFEVVTGSGNDEGGNTFTDDLGDGDYTLTIEITDQAPADTGRTTASTLVAQMDVKITNADAPQINIKKPEPNKTPELTDKQYFTFNGEITDNGEVSNVAIVWFINGNNTDIAERYFETFDFSNPSPTADPREDSTNNIKIWNIGSTDHTQSGNTHKVKFSRTFDIFEDFKDLSGTLTNKQQIMMVVARDLTDNVSTEIIRLSAFNSLPTFSLEVDKGNGTFEKETKSATTMPPSDSHDVKVKIKPDGTIAIERFTVSVNEGTPHECSSAEIESGYTVTIEKPKSGDKSAIEYTAWDKLGNSNTGTFTITFEEIPKITEFICNQEGTTIRMNDELVVQALFDRGITVDKTGGTPTLTLDCYKNATDSTKSGTLVLDYDSGSGSSGLTFKTKITTEVEYKKIVVNKVGNNWISLNGGTIKKGEDMNADLSSDVAASYRTSTLTIDSKPPTITGFAGARAGANFSRDNDKNANIKINFSEPVTAQNGDIVIWMKDSDKETISGEHTWHIPAVISADVFEKIWNNSGYQWRIYLSGSGTEKSIMGKDAYGEPTIVSDGPYKMYTNGLKVNDKPIYQYAVDGGNAVKTNTVIHKVGSVMVPDITTKYVLDWQYDTTSNSGITGAIRHALELVNYHKTTIPLSRLTFNDLRTQATLTLKDSDFIDGIRDGVEYNLEIPEKAFVDDVQNARTQTANSVYTFTVGNVAKPTIRVRRWSTNSTTILDPYHNSSDVDYTKAAVRIDCETPGAAIQYQVTTLTIEQDIPNNARVDYQRDATPPDYMPAPVGAAVVARTVQTPTFNNVGNLATGTPSFGQQNYYKQIEAVQTYSGSFHVGEKNEVNSHRIYIASQASMTGTSDLLPSEDSYEGAFKTVFFSKNPNAGTINSLKVFAVQTPEGVSYTAGWPITMRQHWNTTDGEAGTRDGYKLAYKNGTDYTLVSWELLSDDLFTMTTFGINFQRTINTLANYGSCIWGNEIYCWQ